MHKFAVFFIACVFVGAGAYGSASQQQAQEQGHGNGQTEGTRSSNFSVPIRIVPDPSHEQKAKADAEKSERDEQRENDNLAIQRSVAQSSEEVSQWAAPMFYTSVGALFLSLVTVLASGFAAWFALGSVREARKATAVANKTLLHTEDTNKKQLRAYILADGTHIPEGTPEGYLMVVFAIKNCGQTPATITHLSQFCFTSQTLHPSHFSLMETVPYAGILGGGERFQFHIVNQDQVQQNLRQDVALGKIGVFVRVGIHYRDIFGDEHYSEFTRTIEGRRELNGPFGINPLYPDIMN